MQRTSPPFRAEHIGSIKRPAELMQARTEYACGSATIEELRKAEDAAISKVLELQRASGIKTLTDGEFRRYGNLSISWTAISNIIFWQNILL